MPAKEEENSNLIGLRRVVWFSLIASTVQDYEMPCVVSLALLPLRPEHISVTLLFPVPIPVVKKTTRFFIKSATK